MIRLREYQDGDMARITSAIESNIGDNECREKSNQGMFITLEKDGIPVATGGLIMSDVDTAEAWAKVDKYLVTQSSVKERVSLVRAFSEALDMVTDCLGFPMVFAVVQKGFVRGEKLAKVLKFDLMDDSYKRQGIIYNYYKRSA